MAMKHLPAGPRRRSLAPRWRPRQRRHAIGWPRTATASVSTLMAESDAAFLERNPRAAFYRGDFSNAGSLGDFSRVLHRARGDVRYRRLATIDRAALSGRKITDTSAIRRNARSPRPSPKCSRPCSRCSTIGIQGPSHRPGGVMLARQKTGEQCHRGAYAQMEDVIARRYRAGAGITCRATVELMIEQLETGAPRTQPITHRA